mmetsp:Transcript_30806/g.49466  ORF Transcript_30806/g.49466 Transcript_30806/m.49466 type:complete len:204 (-) Transcript_30806:625-1236(-)
METLEPNRAALPVCSPSPSSWADFRCCGFSKHFLQADFGFGHDPSFDPCLFSACPCWQNDWPRVFGPSLCRGPCPCRDPDPGRGRGPFPALGPYPCPFPFFCPSLSPPPSPFLSPSPSFPSPSPFPSPLSYPSCLCPLYFACRPWVVGECQAPSPVEQLASGPGRTRSPCEKPPAPATSACCCYGSGSAPSCLSRVVAGWRYG